MSRRVRVRPETYHGGVALFIVAALSVGLLLIFRLPWHWEYALAAWLVAVNLAAFGYYGFDKARARSLSRRIPEVVLHGLAVAGGTLGAYAGMAVFRHKTIKAGFRFLFWFIVVMQVLLIAALLYRIYLKK